MDISIIIVNYNVYEDVKKCIESIKKYLNKLTFEIIVIDNGSSDKSIKKITSDIEDVKFISLDINNGFGFANNIGMKNAIGNYFLLVNPDIVFLDNSIEVMFDFINKNDNVGCVGPVQYKPNEGIEYYYTFFPSIYSRLMQENRLYMSAKLMKKRFFDFLNFNIEKGEPFKVEWVIASCLLTRRKIYEELGGFDEAFFLYEEETEWQYRMRNSGWLSFMHPGATVLHNHHSSTSKMGKIFVYYHEFRSRIIFDHKRFSGLRYLIRVFLIELGLGLRVIYFSLRSLFNGSMIVKLNAYFDLFKFNSLPKSSILNSRFVFEKKKNLFLLN